MPHPWQQKAKKDSVKATRDKISIANFVFLFNSSLFIQCPGRATPKYKGKFFLPSAKISAFLKNTFQDIIGDVNGKILVVAIVPFPFSHLNDTKVVCVISGTFLF